ncbi:NAD(P) transhydrogenase subunit alpha [Azohydromonas australica]|uniref:NAD(P) transhydrogenase subunit alpha n=1 Tax=Azohydromonas australica TaxID=364039 RepID=UPI0003FDFF68|nr:NAD(P) transhydrogenase subunit alpha [Azohydromonas australica]
MRIGVPLETATGETRVAVTPETAKKLISQGHRLLVQSGAGVAAAASDAAYAAVGAEVVDARAALGCDLVLKVRSPSAQELEHMQRGATLVGMLNPFDAEGLQRLAAAGITAFALEAAPRTTRAQSMDVLSSQANIAGYKAVIIAADRYQKFFPMLMTAAGVGFAGYKAVIIAADRYQKFFPMLMTAAGTVKAARVVILGVGVAGLQAIATAKRLGAVIEASDVRPSVKEQVESLGAKFIDVPYETADEKDAAEGVGGYARPMPESWLTRQRAEVAKRVALADVVISTALIPGRPAPKLVSAEMVQSMRPGSVIVDLAAANGGNCALTVPGQTAVQHGVTIVGETNLPALVAADASALYARNVLDFLKLICPKEAAAVNVPLDDDIVAACLMSRNGQITRRST